MSDESNKILQKLGDELGHITLIADWVERTKKELSEGTLQVGGTLTCHGAPPALAPSEEPAAATEPAPEAPAEGNVVPAAASAETVTTLAQGVGAVDPSPSEAPALGESLGGGDTPLTANSVQSEAPSAPAQDVALTAE